MSRWGITLPLTGVPLAAHRDLVKSLPDLGYTDVWSAETAGTDAFTPLALVAEWAPTLRLGTAIAPVYTRGPGLLAMTAATIAELAPGRFVLGIGSSSPVIVQGLERPARSTSRSAAPATPCGSCVPPWPARRSPRTTRPSACASSGWNGRRRRRRGSCWPRCAPACCKLAATEADGAITNWLSAEDVRTVRAGDRPGRGTGRADLRLPDRGRRGRAWSRQAADQQLPDRAGLCRVPRLARPRGDPRPDARGVGGGRPGRRPTRPSRTRWSTHSSCTAARRNAASMSPATSEWAGHPGDRGAAHRADPVDMVRALAPTD